VGVGACVAWALSIAVAFEVGGRVGFAVGSAQTSSWETVSAGIAAYRTLSQLPPDAAPELRRSLERDIDAALRTHLLLADSEPSRFALTSRPLDPCHRLPQLAAHRAKHPSPSNDPFVLELIDSAVRRLNSDEIVATPDSRCAPPPAA
jgi:hypothetical protein